MRLPEEVRRSCAAVAAAATHVRIDEAAVETAYADLTYVPAPGLDPERHYLEGDLDAVTAYLVTLDAINFGSGWFPTLNKRVDAQGRTVSGAMTVAWDLADRFRAHGPWTNPQLRSLRTTEVASVLGQRADHELMSLYAQALRSLGAFLGDDTPLELVRAAKGSAVGLAEVMADSMALWADRGFYKRAQLLPADLALAGIGGFRDLDALTIFADNLVPHVLRCDGVLHYDDALAAKIDAGTLLAFGREEREIRACAVVACERIARRIGIPERELDARLWNRGQEPDMKARPRHRCRTVFY